MSGPLPTATRLQRVLVASTFTATPLEKPLDFWFHQLGLNGQAAFPGYQQLFQQLLNPAGDFARNTAGANVALFRFEDLGDSDWESSLHELVTALVSASKRFATPLIVCACPSQHDSFNGSVVHQLTGYHNLHVIDSDQIVTDYQVSAVYDTIGERAAHLPYTAAFYTALATQIVRIVLALDRPPIKVIAVDCDNTLWTGVCGEDGPEGIIIDHGRRMLQERLVRLKSSGILLAVVSKNNESDVCETFAQHPDMALRWADMDACRVNWHAKSWNLINLADELNLGLDSFVFLEDDSKEAAEVRQGCPQITTLQIPATSDALPAFLNHTWIFDQVRAATAEDQQRSRRYSEEAERKRYEQQANNFHEFVKGLNLQTEFLPVEPNLLPRASQLTLRTNQMNTTLERLSEPQLSAVIDASNVNAWIVSVSDRFGDYGLVGLLAVQSNRETTTVRNFLLSCRALGRGVEHRMLAHAAKSVPARFIEVPFVVGPRNSPAIDFLKGIPFGSNITSVFRFEALRLAGLEFEDVPVRAPRQPSEADGSDPILVSAAASLKVDYQRIATEFATADDILRAIEAQSKTLRSPHSPVFHTPQTDLERGLAVIWCELLGVNRVDIEDDFFDLGGHSLLAVQLLSRIHRDLDVELPDSVIYADKLRISSLARAIELHQLGFGDQEGFESALAEIESLSDEEVARLLSETAS